MPCLQSGAATERPEITHLTFPPIQEVVWLQPQETHVTNIQKTLITENHKITHMPESNQINEVESHRSPMKETSSQVSGSSTERHLGNQTGSTPVQSLNDSKKPHSEVQRQEMNILADDNGDDNISPPKITKTQIEEQLVRDDINN